MNYRKFKNIIEVNKKVVIFGGCGFIGCNIAITLAKLGNQILIVDNLSNSKLSSIDEIINFENVEFIEMDICNLEQLIDVTKGYDYFINLAAFGSIPRSITFPEIYISNNVVGTFNVFKAAVENKVEAVVYASSSSVYGDSPILPKKEDVVGNVLVPYALTKKQNEEWASMFAKTYELNTIGLRYFNIFGPAQRHDSTYAAVIPKFIHKLYKNELFEIHGDGLQSRDFTYIENAIQANLLGLIYAKKYKGEVYNVACNEQITLIDIFSKIEKITGKKAKVTHVDTRQGDVKHSKANIDKIQNDFGYEILKTCDEGLVETIKYFMGSYEK
ncbi:MAG: NAD-dependent epimerase/dehydratase family protein [Mycoplasmatales bacterium]